MVELITAIYGTLCWLVFKKFRLVPVNDYTVVTAVLIPVVAGLLGFFILNMAAPVAKDVRLTAPITPMVALVQGQVSEIVAKPNTPLQKGDVLLRIDDTLYRSRLEQVQAQLALAKTRLEQYETLSRKGVGSDYDRQQYEAEVERLTGAVDEAEFNLANCTVTAPADGMVTQLLVRPGQFVMPMVFSQLMLFVHDEHAWVGSFPQQALQGMADGEEAEIAVTAAPGHVFSAKVLRVIPAMGEGMVSASGQPITGAYDRPAGRVLVMMKITDPRADDLKLPVGTDATATIFTSGGAVINLVRGLILRIHSWENWIFA
ncbi:MAG: biotin/lipoyl-binding protein [Sedimenticolaceae bacterium]